MDSSKFRVCVHLHKYHNKDKEINFWSEITGIPKNQFINPYLKLNGGKRIKINYHGCVSIYYYSNDTARKLLANAMAFLSKFSKIEK